ncbi:uncharacterized protein TNCV_3811801 [Trichonephila clavipes]|nr:uncharacterized protein TNCV_3811801 [Trichonephila clavipes]
MGDFNVAPSVVCDSWGQSKETGAIKRSSGLSRPSATTTDEDEYLSITIVRVHYFVRGGFVDHRSRVSSKHLSSHLPVDGVRFLGGQKGVALQLQDARVGVGSNKDADHSRCSEK